MSRLQCLGYRAANVVNHLFYNNAIRDANTVPDFVLTFPELSPPGFYTTLPLFRGEPALLSDHLQRLSASLANGEDHRLTEDFIVNVLGELVRLNEMGEAGRARLSVVTGSGESRSQEVVITAVSVDLDSLCLKRCEGVELEVGGVRRFKGDRHFQTKRLGWLCPGWKPDPYQLFTNLSGEVCEATYGNFFAVTDNGQLWTPPIESPCLPGITRYQVMGLAKELGLETKEAPIKLAEANWAEAFITSAIGGIVPVGKVGKWMAKQPRGGRITRSLQEKLAEKLAFYRLAV